MARIVRNESGDAIIASIDVVIVASHIDELLREKNCIPIFAFNDDVAVRFAMSDRIRCSNED